MQRIVSFCNGLLFSGWMIAQCIPSTFTTFQLNVGGPGDERAHSVIQNTAGDYFVVGETNSFGAGAQDIFLLKLSDHGQLLWAKTYGSAGTDDGNSLVLTKTQDGGVVIGGLTTGFGAQGSWDGLLFKVDSLGNPMWAHQFTGSGHENFRGITTLDNGTILVTGNSGTAGLGVLDRWLMQISSTGIVNWSTAYGIQYNEQSTHAIQLANKDILLTGSVSAFGGNSGNTNSACLTRVDSMGNYISNYIYQPSVSSQRVASFASASTLNNEVISVGYTESFGATLKDVLVFVTDSVGQVSWAKRYGTVGEERGVDVSVMPDGSFRVVGFSTGLTSGEDIFQLHIDSVGGLTEIIAYGNQADETLDNWSAPFKQTAEGGMIITGASNSFGSSDEDIYILKANDCGRSLCNEEAAGFTEASIPLVATSYSLNSTTPPAPVPVVLSTGSAPFNSIFLCADTSLNASISDASNAGELLPYPNPTSDLIRIPGNGYRQYQVIDLTGRIVLLGSMNSSDPLNIATLRTDTYILETSDLKGIVRRYRIVKH